MKVDPDALRAWSKWLDGLSTDIEALSKDLGGPDATDQFPGTSLGGSLNDVRKEVGSALRFFASRPKEMAEIAKGVGDKYEITDTAFADQLRAMGGIK